LLGIKVTSALALAALAILTPQSTVLRRELKPGAADVYEIKVTNTNIPGEGSPGEPRTMKFSWTATYKVGEIDQSKIATIDVLVNDFEVIGGRFVDGPPPKNRTMQATLDERSRIRSKTSGKPTAGSNQGWLITDFIQFPEQEVKVGDAWDIELPPSIVLSNDKNVTLKAKLAGEEDFQGTKAWSVTVDGDKVPIEQKVKFSTDGGTTMQDATITGTAKISIKALIDKTNGRTLSITAKVHKDQEFNAPGAPAPTPSSVDYSASMKLKAG
jgi:hypothetical protein